MNPSKTAISDFTGDIPSILKGYSFPSVSKAVDMSACFKKQAGEILVLYAQDDDEDVAFVKCGDVCGSFGIFRETEYVPLTLGAKLKAYTGMSLDAFQEFLKDFVPTGPSLALTPLF